MTLTYILLMLQFLLFACYLSNYEHCSIVLYVAVMKAEVNLFMRLLGPCQPY